MHTGRENQFSQDLAQSWQTTFWKVNKKYSWKVYKSAKCQQINRPKKENKKFTLKGNQYPQDWAQNQQTTFSKVSKKCSWKVDKGTKCQQIKRTKKEQKMHTEREPITVRLSSDLENNFLKSKQKVFLNKKKYQWMKGIRMYPKIGKPNEF